MRISLPGMFHNTEHALRQSPDRMSCAMAYSVGELIDNLRVLKDGGCTVEEFFACYVFEAKNPAGKLAESVRKGNYLCMREDVSEAEED